MSEPVDLPDPRVAWWLEARFGMFIHWGLYSVRGLDCWKMHDMGTPVDAYARAQLPEFKAEHFDAPALVETARRGGCRYVIMGTRHHEGYCLWNTRTSAFSSVSMGPGRDFIAEFTDAARAAGLRVGLYYSLLDWRYRAYWLGPRNDPEGWKKLVDVVHAQVEELMTNYGQVDVLWYDGAWGADSESPHTIAPRSRWGWGFHPSDADLAEAWEAEKLNAMVRRLQPEILLNNRTGLPGDFGTPEQVIRPEDRPWELCDSMGDLWGASPQDRNRKSTLEILIRLITCVSKDGNMLLNVGPRPDGRLQEWEADILARIGTWLSRHGEAIYGCGAEWQNPFCRGLAPWRTTRRGDTLYLHLLRYPGTSFGIASFQHDYWLESAELLTTAQPLSIAHEPSRDIIRGLPETPPDDLMTVVRVKIRPKTDEEHRSSRSIGVEDPDALCVDGLSV